MAADTSTPLATHAYQDGELNSALEFLKRTRWELRQLRRVCVWTDHLRVYDVNGDVFEIVGLGYEDADITPVLNNLNAAFDPSTIHQPIDGGYKEFKLGRCRPWAEDRVM
jgi:hypothetical protein